MNEIATSPSIFVNDQPHALDGSRTLSAVLKALGLAERKGIAAAVNGEVVPRSEWPARPLADQDRVLVIRATQGG